MIFSRTMTNRFVIFWMPVIFLCLLIFYNSSHPCPESIPDLPFLDKIIHCSVYGLLGGLIFRAIRNRKDYRRQTGWLFLAILLTALYGISDEIHQYFVPERTADILDVVADILGGIGGVLLYQRVASRFYRGYPYHSHIDKIENFI